MTETDLLAWIAGFSAALGVLYLSIIDKPVSRFSWIFPCGLSLLFLLVSLRTIVSEGPTGFWTEHTRNRWGNQIWFDLLLGVSAAISFALPRARKLEMRVVLWVILCLVLGSIGLYAFIGRLLYLEQQRESGDRNEYT